MTSINPCLWFDDNLEEAMEFYTAIFPNSRIGNVSRYGDAGPGPAGSVMAADFELDGLTFRAINGGPQFTFSEAISFSVACADQAEVDRYWDALLADGGEESMCGWLKDRFGLSWQIVPDRLYELVSDPDPARAEAATRAMLGMRKIVVADLEAAVAAV
jgi:predicted 3-demethylubiquinone-9 3-methyltransferase (glyoxalase superfamily)